MANGAKVVPANVEVIAQIVGLHSQTIDRHEEEIKDLKKLVASSITSKNVMLGGVLVLLINGILMWVLTSQLAALQRMVK